MNRSESNPKSRQIRPAVNPIVRSIRLQHGTGPRPPHDIWVIGGGEVVRKRYAPALRRHLSMGKDFVVHYADLYPSPPFELTGREDYVRADPQLGLPHSARRLITPRSLVVIACSTPAHCSYIHQNAPTGAGLLCEKPLCLDTREASHLRIFGRQLECCEHFLYKPQVHDLLTQLRRSSQPALEMIRNVRAFEFDLLEAQGTNGRDLDDVIFDMAWHGIAVPLAILRQSGEAADVRIAISSSPTVATYQPYAGEPAPENFTAADLEAVLVLGSRVVKISVRAGKGMAVTRKRLTMEFNDRPNVYLNLDDADPVAAHERLLGYALAGDRPASPLRLEDNIEIVSACERACDLKIDAGPYRFGTTPPFADALARPMMSDMYLG